MVQKNKSKLPHLRHERQALVGENVAIVTTGLVEHHEFIGRPDSLVAPGSRSRGWWWGCGAGTCAVPMHVGLPTNHGGARAVAAKIG